MATTVTTSTASYATAGGRHTGVTSGGTDWVMQYSLANTRFEFWYSTDDGATWAENTALRRTAAATAAATAEFFIGEHDHAVAAYGGTSDNVICRSHTLSTTLGWDDFNDTRSVLGAGDQVRCRVFDVDGTGNYAVLHVFVVGGVIAWWLDYYTSAGTLVTSESSSLSSIHSGWFDIDFQHTGDGKTTSGSYAPWFIVYREAVTDQLEFRKVAYGGSSYAAGTARVIDATAGATDDALAMVCDGSRVIIAYIDNTDDLVPQLAERDVADTTTTARTPPALSDGAITSLSVGFDGESDIRVYAVGTTSDDVKRVTFDRSGGTWGAWSTLEAATATTGTLSVQPGYQGDGLNWVVTSGAGSPYDVVFERDLFNTAPTGATWVSPVNNSSQDETATLAVAWTFNDPDAGDTQSAYALKRIISAVTTYYRASDSTWQVGEVKNVSSTAGVTLPATWGADTESVALSVKTWDFLDTEGVYGSTLTLIGSVPVTAVLTAPVDASTVIASSVTVTWTATEQTAYRVRLLTSGNVVLFDSGKTVSTALTLTSAAVLANGLVGAKAEVRVWNNDDLEGATDTHTFDVTYTEPATPTYVVTANDAVGRLDLVITDPAPGGGQPTVTSHDVFVRVAASGRPIGERTVNDDGIRIATGVANGGTFYDWAAASGVDFEYRTRAHASNGGTVYGAWT